MIDKNKISEKWNEFKTKAHQRWNKLTEEDIDKLRDEPDSLSQHLQNRYGYSKDRSADEANTFFRSFSPEQTQGKVFNNTEYTGDLDAAEDDMHAGEVGTSQTHFSSQQSEQIPRVPKRPLEGSSVQGNQI